MKIMCHCGIEVRHEPPFDDFHVERVPCSPSCKRINDLRNKERLSDVFPLTPTPPRLLGILGH